MLEEEQIFNGIESLMGEFDVTEIKGIDVSSKDITLKVNSEENSLSVNAGCNILLSNFHPTEGIIVVEPPVGTRMYCEGRMENEERLAKVLPEITKITHTKDKYLFLSNTNEVLISVLKNEESE